MSCVSEIQKYGVSPANIQWTVVRGDTATLKIEFWENDETTAYDITGWIFESEAYDPITDITYPLDTLAGSNYVTITAPATDTEAWGTGLGSVVAELSFDLQVTIPGLSGQDNTVWTPVIGTICVLGDITGGSL